MRDALFAFFGTSVDSRFALAALERVGLHPALIVDSKEFPPELYNTDWDFFLVASYGKILKKEVLGLPRRGCLNIHPSLLPRYRGPSPYVSAILQDERAVGVSIMLMEERMDSGPILAQARIEIEEEEWPPKGLVLSELLFTEGVTLLSEVLPQWLKGELDPVPQEEQLATYTKKFNDADAEIPEPQTISPGASAREAFLKIQAFDNPQGGPRALFINTKGKRVLILDAEWKDGALTVRTVLPEGRKKMSYADYLRGQRSTA
jgi:methionyl-tRNA formyltransferase